MKITIENPLKHTLTFGRAVQELGSIIQVIASITDETELRKEFKTRHYETLEFGFGGHHMWVCQKADEDKERIILVSF